MNIPKRPATLIKHAEAMEKQLKSEKRRFGCYDDSAGVRYLIGSYYLIAGDLDNALRHYEWFEKTFPGDAGEPGQYLSWTYALYKSGNLKKAYNKFLHTLIMNPYVIARLHNIDFTLPFEWSCNIMSKEWADDIPDEIYNLWKNEDIIWLRESYDNEKTREIFDEYCALEIRIEKEHVGPERSRLVDKVFELRRIEV